MDARKQKQTQTSYNIGRFSLKKEIKLKFFTSLNPALGFQIVTNYPYT